jgi:uncharacterized protein YecE (DUF72 family)
LPYPMGQLVESRSVPRMGRRIGTLLVKLPSNLAFDLEPAEPLLRRLKVRVDIPIACEPRHPFWFKPGVEELPGRLRIGRVAADPSEVPPARRLGGWIRLTCIRPAWAAPHLLLVLWRRGNRGRYGAACGP